jgi:CheY-specific phosphatase CheX
MGDQHMSVNQLVPVELSNCVKEATMATFEMICGTELTHSYESNENTSCEGIASIISLVGDVSWSLLLCLPRDTACGLSQRFTGFEIPFDSADMGDTV